MRIKIEIEDDQVSVKTDDAERIDEDQEAEKSWFRDAIGHKWVVLDHGERLTGKGWFACSHRDFHIISNVKDPTKFACHAYYELPPPPDHEDNK